MSLDLHSQEYLNNQYDPVSGIAFGTPDQLLSPAYWKERCAQAEVNGHTYVSTESTLAEEVGFCLLGGFGVREELASAYYEKLKLEGIFALPFRRNEVEIEALLRSPVTLFGKLHRYRFPRQKAKRISYAMRQLSNADFPTCCGKKFRDELSKIHGIGPKTASWIARNWIGAEDVAILDVHLVRACKYIHLFDEDLRLPRDYRAMEALFLHFAKNLGVRPSVLDAVIWDDMRMFGSRLVSGRQLR